MAGYKEYVIDFKIGDGTTHSIPFKIPLGENGGYYTPTIEQISDTEIKVSYTPSMADMPTIEPVAIKIPGSGGNVEDGFSPIATVEQTTTGAVISITDKDGTTTATITNGKDGADGQPGKDGADGAPGEKGDKGDPGEKGETGAQGIQGEKGDKGDPGEPGQKGEQGIPGEKGDKGDKGDTGAPGADGANGKDGSDGKDGTSVTVTKVTESTESGGSNIVEFSDGKTLTVKNGKDGTVQNSLLFAESVDWLKANGDKTKEYVLPDGYIYAFITTEVEVEGYKNWIHHSTDSSGSLYNECGYKVGYRLNSTSTEKQLSDCVTFGFIPVTKNSVVRIKNFAKGLPSHTGNYIHLYALIDSDYVLLTKNQEGYTPSVASKGIGTTDGNGIYTFTPSEILDDDSIAFMRVSSIATTNGGTATKEDAEKFIITVDEEITNNTGGVGTESAWVNNGRAIAYHLPNYWVSHLQEKAEQIQSAMETAGRNKSAFLWYTDSHWANGSSKKSPLLLQYLCDNTPMNKVNFGGDIVGDSLLERSAMSYLYEWRRAVKALPNHHSVIGNHDALADYAYAFLIAPEESSDMVMGGDFYYYIDNPCEKTRYLYLDSGRYSLSDGETAFIIDALKNTLSGWHIVVISHIWFQYSAAATPTVGSMNGSMQKLLNLFDAYNSRGSGSVTMTSVANTYDFTNCGGKVEFCIGGHIHVDYDITSTGGIPVIITTADANQNRVPDSEVDSGTIGTITESAVFGIIADYNSNKITVVGVGRGTDRVISY